MAPSLSPGSALADSFPGRQIAISFDDMPGWADDDHQAAMAAFLRTCRRAAERVPRTRPSGVDGAVLARVCAWALAERPSDARAFFEAHFTPYQVEDAGRLTGYFEPQVTASFTRTGSYQHPLYALPPDLVELPASAASLGLEEEVTWGPIGGNQFRGVPRQGRDHGRCSGGPGP
jgi:membrane-bound lytic murein transglycosylase A